MIVHTIKIKTLGQSGVYTLKETDNVNLVDFIIGKTNAMGVADCNDLIGKEVKKYLTAQTALLTAKGDKYESTVVRKLNVCVCLIISIKSVKKS